MTENYRNNGLGRKTASMGQSTGHQDQPRKAPMKGSGGRKLFTLVAILIVLLAGGIAIYILHPSWLPFSGRPTDVALNSEELVVFDGRMGQMVGDQNNIITQGVADESHATVIIQSTRRNARPMGTTDGAYIQLKPDLSSELAGKRVRITVWARAASEHPSTLFAIAYSNAKLGSTGWIAFDPTKQLQPFGFVYKLPAAAGQNGAGNYIGIWSDVGGGGGALEVRLITVQVLGQQS